MINNWVDGLGVTITVCDKNGKIIYMNDRSTRQFAKYGGRQLIDKSLYDCHPEEACRKIRDIMAKPETNIYTTEKKGIRKMIVQSPWYENDEFGGLVELSFELPAEIPHFVRD